MRHGENPQRHKDGLPTSTSSLWLMFRKDIRFFRKESPLVSGDLFVFQCQQNPQRHYEEIN
jgi:hypothetical protein